MSPPPARRQPAEPLRGGRTQSLARRGGDLDRHLHAGARYLDCERRAPVYRRQPRRERRREHLGADELSGRERGRPADQRLAVRRDRTQALLHGLRRHLHRELRAVRAGAEPGDADLLSRASGHRRRRHGAERAGDARRHLSREQALARLRAVRRRGAGGADRRPDARRLAHRQPVLALDFPHQRPDRRDLARSGELARHRTGGAGTRAQGAHRARAQRRLDRLHPGRAVSRLPRDRPRQGPGGRLVLVELHRVLRRPYRSSRSCCSFRGS